MMYRPPGRSIGNSSSKDARVASQRVRCIVDDEIERRGRPEVVDDPPLHLVEIALVHAVVDADAIVEAARAASSASASIGSGDISNADSWSSSPRRSASRAVLPPRNTPSSTIRRGRSAPTRPRNDSSIGRGFIR